VCLARNTSHQSTAHSTAAVHFGIALVVVGAADSVEAAFAIAANPVEVAELARHGDVSRCTYSSYIFRT